MSLSKFINCSATKGNHKHSIKKRDIHNQDYSKSYKSCSLHTGPDSLAPNPEYRAIQQHIIH